MKPLFQESKTSVTIRPALGLTEEIYALGAAEFVARQFPNTRVNFLTRFKSWIPELSHHWSLAEVRYEPESAPVEGACLEFSPLTFEAALATERQQYDILYQAVRQSVQDYKAELSRMGLTHSLQVPEYNFTSRWHRSTAYAYRAADYLFGQKFDRLHFRSAVYLPEIPVRSKQRDEVLADLRHQGIGDRPFFFCDLPQVTDPEKAEQLLEAIFQAIPLTLNRPELEDNFQALGALAKSPNCRGAVLPYGDAAMLLYCLGCQEILQLYSGDSVHWDALPVSGATVVPYSEDEPLDTDTLCGIAKIFVSRNS